MILGGYLIVSIVYMSLENSKLFEPHNNFTNICDNFNLCWRVFIMKLSLLTEMEKHDD